MVDRTGDEERPKKAEELQNIPSHWGKLEERANLRP